MLTQLKLTEDGSHTLFVPAIDECYHSTHGAIQESRHIFMEAGLKQCLKPEVHILEIGFGTGLNAFLTLLEAGKSGKQIRYTALELYPVEVNKALQLNYPLELDADKSTEFELLHTSEWEKETGITGFFKLTKIQADFTTFEFKDQYDVVYFDAFSPEKQPGMWKTELFDKIYRHCQSGAIMTTYCAKGMVRRAMQEAGFIVERLAGPPGKREILRATKTGSGQ